MSIWVVVSKEYNEAWIAFKSKKATEWHIQKHYNESQDKWHVDEVELRDA